jgi:hypothetical protein
MSRGGKTLARNIGDIFLPTVPCLELHGGYKMIFLYRFLIGGIVTLVICMICYWVGLAIEMYVVKGPLYMPRLLVGLFTVAAAALAVAIMYQVGVGVYCLLGWTP